METRVKTQAKPYVETRYLYKSNLINEAIFSLNAIEYRILLLLIAQVQEEHEGLRYRFYTKNIAELFGIKSNNASSKIRDSVSSLHTHTLVMKDERYEVQHNWLITSIYYREQGCFDLELNPNLKRYFLDLQGQFTKYKIQSVLAIADMATIRLYELLKQYERLKVRKFPFEQLRKLLGYLDTQYTETYDFKRRVLTTAVKTINEKTDIAVTFSEVKEGKKVVGYQFTIQASESSAPKSLENHRLLPLSLIHELEAIGYNSAGVQRLAERYTETFIREQLVYTQQKLAANQISCAKTYFRRRVNEQAKKQKQVKKPKPVITMETESQLALQALPTPTDTVQGAGSHVVDFLYSTETIELLQRFGLTMPQINGVCKKHPEDYVLANFTYTTQRMEHVAIQAPAHYLLSAIKHNYAQVGRIEDSSVEESSADNPMHVSLSVLVAEYQIERGYARSVAEIEMLHKKYRDALHELTVQGLTIDCVKKHSNELASLMENA